MAGGGVPGDGDGLAGELERDGPLDGAGGAVAGLAGAEDLLEVSDILQVHSRRLPAEVEITNPAEAWRGVTPAAVRSSKNSADNYIPTPNRDQQGVTEAVTAAASHKIPGACARHRFTPNLGATQRSLLSTVEPGCEPGRRSGQANPEDEPLMVQSSARTSRGDSTSVFRRQTELPFMLSGSRERSNMDGSGR